MKIAVVLFNLGGPDDLKAVRPFLLNLFLDKNIIRLPALFRYPLAYLISSLRYKKASKIYMKLGGKSPINDETQTQVDVLQNLLQQTNENDYKVFFCMQYWHPMHDEVVDNVVDYNPDQIILVPLYPQFSTTTTKSSFEVWHKKAKNKLSHIPTKSICCYPENHGFIKAYGDLIIEKLNNAQDKDNVIIIFSAHGIPQDCVDDGDPYEEQIEKSAKAVHNYLKTYGFQNPYQVTYQSKVGPKKWLEPDTESVILELSKQNKSICIVPIAFTSEHSETLVELDMDYSELAYDNNVKEYIRVPTVQANNAYINGLASGIIDISQKTLDDLIASPSICSQKFKECPKKIKGTPCISI